MNCNEKIEIFIFVISPIINGYLKIKVQNVAK